MSITSHSNMLLSLTRPHEMPGMSLPTCISLSCRRRREAAAEVGVAIPACELFAAASCRFFLVLFFCPATNANCVLVGRSIRLYLNSERMEVSRFGARQAPGEEERGGICFWRFGWCGFGHGLEVMDGYRGELVWVGGGALLCGTGRHLLRPGQHPSRGMKALAYLLYLNRKLVILYCLQWPIK